MQNRPPFAILQFPQPYQSIYRSNLGPQDHQNKMYKLIAKEPKDQNLRLPQLTPMRVSSQAHSISFDQHQIKSNRQPSPETPFDKRAIQNNSQIVQQNVTNQNIFDNTIEEKQQEYNDRLVRLWRDSMKIEDIEGTKPKNQSIRTKRCINPVDPKYPIPYGNYEPHSVRNIQYNKPQFHLKVDDISGAIPAHQHLTRRERKQLETEQEKQIEEKLSKFKLDKQSEAKLDEQDLIMSPGPLKTGRRLNYKRYDATDIFPVPPSQRGNMRQGYLEKIDQKVKEELEKNPAFKTYRQYYAKVRQRDPGQLQPAGRGVLSNDIDEFGCYKLFRNYDPAKETENFYFNS